MTTNLFANEHDALQKQLDALKKIIVILEYPPALMHEVRKGWPELQLLLRGVHYYFSTLLPQHFIQEETALFSRLLPKLTGAELQAVEELKAEHDGINHLIKPMINLIKPWLTANRAPARSDAHMLRDFENELRFHLERHEQLENDYLLPLAQRVLSEQELAKIADEIQRSVPKSGENEPDTRRRA